MDEREPAARIIWKKPSGLISRLAVSTPPISALMILSKAASLSVRYKFRIGLIELVKSDQLPAESSRIM